MKEIQVSDPQETIKAWQRFQRITPAVALGIPPFDEEIILNYSKRLAHGQEWKTFARHARKKFGRIDAYGQEGRKLKVGIDTSEPLTHWLPTTAEIMAIILLAKAVAPDKERPRILDLDSGTGLVAYSLAQTGHVEVVRTTQMKPGERAEIYEYAHPNLHYFNISPWKAAVEFAPKYDPEVKATRMSLLKELKQAIETVDNKAGTLQGEEWDLWTDRMHNTRIGFERSASTFTEDSKVDLAMSIYSPPTYDPTLLLRDVVHPKAIVYVGNNNSYLPDQSGITPFDLVSTITNESYLKGAKYRELATWNTFSRQDWLFYLMYNRFRNPRNPDLNRSRAYFQIRKRTEPNPVELGKIRDMPWEDELREIMRDSRRKVIDGVRNLQTKLGVSCYIKQ